MEPARPVDLSIILDTETLKITGELLLDGRISLWEEAARRIAPKTYEIILCCEHEMDSGTTLPEGWKACVRPGSGYYALKTAGGKMAVGEILFWSDIDCRPDADYFANLMRHFAETDASVLGGRTFYDDTGFAGRVNSAISWGYLHAIEKLDATGSFLGHNLACKRSATGDFFGPYSGRYGGDEYITSVFRRKGDRLLVFQDLMLYHESPSHSFRGLLDRHLREIGRIAAMESVTGAATASQMMREARRLKAAKWNIFQQQAAKFGFAKADYPKVRLLLTVYSWLDMAAVCLVTVFPSLLHQWLRYQFGPEEKCVTVDRLLVEPAAARA